MNKKTVIPLIVILTAAIVTWVLLTQPSKPSEEAPVTTDEPEEKEDEEGFPAYTYPFTGIETDEQPTNRAIAIMINNQKEARPQSGLHEADIVFELLAEGNITRFLALFHSSLPERAGPVRSARQYYFNLADDYDALYIYHGAAKFVDQMIQNEGIEFLNGAIYDNDKQLFIRESFRKAPHNSYLLFDEVYNHAESKGYDVEFAHNSLPFLEEDEVVQGEEATYVKIQYYNNSPIVEYEYDATKEKYIRINDGAQTVDLETNTPIELDNIFIIEADHQVIDSEGRRAIDLQSGGYGYLLQQGKVQRVNWKNDGGYLVPVKDDETVPFVPGQTWVNVIQTNPPNNVEQIHIAE